MMLSCDVASCDVSPGVKDFTGETRLASPRTFEADEAIEVNVQCFDHLVDLVICDVNAQVCDDMMQLCS